MIDTDARDGQALMAWHEGRGVPWHSLGTMIPAGMDHSEEVIQYAGLDHQMVLRPAYYHGLDGRLAQVHPPRFAVVRDSDGKCVGEVGKSFVVLQNRDAFDGMDEWLQDGRMTYETAGALYGGSRVFILARIGEDFLVGGKDPVVPYVLLQNGHDGTKSLCVKPVSTRVVCANTLTVALGERTAEIVIRHTKTMPERLAESGKALGLASRRQAEAHQAFERMAQTAADQALAERVMDLVAPAPAASDGDLVTERKQNERLEMWKLLNGGSKSVQFAGGADNRWGLFNWATEWIDWREPRKGQDLDAGGSLEKRALYSLEGFGSGHRQRVFDLLAAPAR
jgi:phage/plasmid-like protein (TIGR03299 family)